jgi:hypothetical protein
MDPLRDDTSAMSESPPGAKPNSWSRDERFGARTLSSLALPILELGSSCSLSILKRVDRPGMIRLVLKSFVLGSAEPRSNTGWTSSCWTFFPFFVFFVMEASSSATLSFFLLKTPIVLV